MSRFDNPVPQFFGDDGTVGDGWKLDFFESGTSTRKDTFKDVNLTIPNANPIILAAGRVPNCFFDGTAKVRLLDNNDVLQWERDPVGGTTATQFGDWDSVTSYSVTDIVRGSDNEYYISIINSNAGNDPTSTPAAWSQLVNIVDWNTNETYAVNDTVRGSDGKLYRGLTASNQGNDPTSSGSDWRTSVEAVSGVITADLVGDVTGDLTGGIIETTGNAVLNVAIIPIGDWDMASSTSVNVAHGFADITKIMNIQGLIRNDDATISYPLTLAGKGSLGEASISQIDATNVLLITQAAGEYQSTDFNATSYNRGWLTVWYID
ncbi:hypothetical protein KAR91_09100 [Candidatus Pacearchaeota archaeon]|nr:hypothetical protein [Candidatus Pacearchaeota archaeon]